MEANISLFNEMRNEIEFEPEDNVFGTIWKQYERVIVESLITSFESKKIMPEKQYIKIK